MKRRSAKNRHDGLVEIAIDRPRSGKTRVGDARDLSRCISAGVYFGHHYVLRVLRRLCQFGEHAPGFQWAGAPAADRMGTAARCGAATRGVHAYAWNRGPQISPVVQYPWDSDPCMAAQSSADCWRDEAWVGAHPADTDLRDAAIPGVRRVVKRGVQQLGGDWRRHCCLGSPAYALA